MKGTFIFLLLQNITLKFLVIVGIVWNIVDSLYLNICLLTILQMYRLTVRSSKESVSQEVCELLADQF